MKKCSCCKEIKDYSFYHVNNRGKDGLCTQCKDCVNVKRRAHRQRNPELMKERGKQSRVKYKAKRQEYGKEYNLKNRERLKEAERIRYMPTKETIRLKNEKIKDAKRALFLQGKKECTWCKEIKKLDCFSKMSAANDGHDCHCRLCGSEKGKRYHEKNREYLNINSLKRYHKDPEKSKSYGREWKKKNPDYVKERWAKMPEEKKEEKREKDRKWYKENPEKILKARLRDKEKTAAQSKIYSKKNRKRISAKQKERLKTDINYKISMNLRSRVNDCIIRGNKSATTLELIGCSFDEFRLHIEKQFAKGMNWDNHGLYGWHFDHIVPTSSFNFERAEDQRRCFNYKNYQPLWAKDNIKKSNKVIDKVDKKGQYIINIY